MSNSFPYQSISNNICIEQGFIIIACEADWPPAYRVNRWIKGIASSIITDANDALKDFTRFPSWMWWVLIYLSFNYFNISI